MSDLTCLCWWEYPEVRSCNYWRAGGSRQPACARPAKRSPRIRMPAHKKRPTTISGGSTCPNEVLQPEECMCSLRATPLTVESWLDMVNPWWTWFVLLATSTCYLKYCPWFQVNTEKNKAIHSYDVLFFHLSSKCKNWIKFKAPEFIYHY